MSVDLYPKPPLPAWERLAAGFIDFLVLLVGDVILGIPIVGGSFSKVVSFELAHKHQAHLASNPVLLRLERHVGLDFEKLAIVIAALTAAYLIGMYLGTGATVGKLALGLRVTRTDGRPLTVANAVLRSIPFWLGNPLFPIFGAWICLLQYIGGTLVVIFRPDHRGPEDFLGSSMVVRAADRGRSLAELASLPPPQVPPDRPPVATPVRGGHLPGWGPTPTPPEPPDSRERRQ